MIIPIWESEKVYKVAVTDWIVESDGTRARYEIASTIDDKAKVNYFVYLCLKNSLFDRVFRTHRIGRSRVLANTTGDERDFLYQFNLIRSVVWDAYGKQIPFRFLDAEELGTIEFASGFRGSVKLYFIRACRAVLNVLEFWR